MLTFLILIMWNDTDTPFGYFITFRACGTWLHGDERGSIDRYQIAIALHTLRQVEDGIGTISNNSGLRQWF